MYVCIIFILNNSFIFTSSHALPFLLVSLSHLCFLRLPFRCTFAAISRLSGIFLLFSSFCGLTPNHCRYEGKMCASITLAWHLGVRLM